ncbi:cation diffusion facilitator family transporter [Methanocalculus alkaliphilus]|uniref:cation diffusion facilitator family transporter n=1 Tax=Methanocalculus alkaliphilus TaxID=768730 RepID=UPI0020A22CEF|nr:cation diffusion facilitator family transporter [Methanocalculus alkaliphilus]MCP1716004.1 cation diffusion facilitator family transporter [Methanocalculus alkaliphilus]
MSDSPPHDDSSREKTGIALVAVFSNTFLVILKLVIGFITGSVAIISDAVHSATDIIASSIAYFAVRKSARPPDDQHSFGHGKYESLSGLIEAVLILAVAGFIIYEAAGALIAGESTLNPDLIGLGLVAVGVSALANIIISHRMMAIAIRTESIALESDAWHLRTDVYTSVGVFAGLILIHFTGILLLDAVIAIGVGLVIIRTGVELVRKALGQILDTRLPEEDVVRIEEILKAHCTRYVNFHGLRTRRSGPDRFIEFHVMFDQDVLLTTAHDLADHLEADLKTEFPKSHITIHMEPCHEECNDCGVMLCPARRE